MSVSKIKATLPKGEYKNGLDAIADKLAEQPHRIRAVIMLVDCGRVQLDHAEDGETEDIPPGLTATARIRRVEAIEPGTREDKIARWLLARAADRRNGRVALPIDTEADVLFGVDLETGEKRGSEDE